MVRLRTAALPLALAVAVAITALAATARQAATPVPFPTPATLPAATPRAGEPLAVVATTGILADFVRQVGGERVAVGTILPANADPHDFEPAPEDLVAVEDAAVVVQHGLGLDEWADDLIDNAGTDAAVVVATEGIATLASEDEEFAEGDPHVWFDPTRVRTMVDTIAAGLTAADPDGGASYAARAAAYQADLDALDAAIQRRIATIPEERRKLVTNHDALAYFAHRYVLTVVGTVIPSLDTRAEPSAREIDALLGLIEAEGVTAIFAENTTSPDLAARLAEDAGVTIVDDLYTDSLGDEWSGADTYLGLMQTDTGVIVAALGGDAEAA